MNTKDNPLATWLRLATPKQRTRCATLAGTTVTYLYSIAGGHRQQISARLAFQIEDAMHRMASASRGKLPLITARDLAFMHDVAGL